MRSRRRLALLAGFFLWALLGAVIWAFAPVPGVALDGRTNPQRAESVVADAPVAMAPALAVVRDDVADIDPLSVPFATEAAAPVVSGLIAFVGVLVLYAGAHPDDRPRVPAFQRRGPPVASVS